MSHLREMSDRGPQRLSKLVTLKIVNKLGNVLNEQDVWECLQLMFRNHLYLDCVQAEIRPDVDGKSCIDEK